MDADGQRKGWTTSSTSPGVFQVECGEHGQILTDVDEKEALRQFGISCCKNGNTIIIRNKNGKIRIRGH